MAVIRYGTRSYFNVRSKADISQLNIYRTEPNYEWKREKLKSKKRIRSIGKQSVESVSPEEEKEGYGGKN